MPGGGVARAGKAANKTPMANKERSSGVTVVCSTQEGAKKAFGRLVALILGLPTPGEDQTIGITLHGIGLAEADNVEDEERQSAGDVVAFNLFVTGFDPE
jgi:hypothetical protein